MPSPDETLAAIDDVITDWRGSPDAMVWTAEPPRFPAPPRLHVDADAAERLLNGGAAAVRAFHDALQPVADALVRGFAAWAQSPAMQQLVAFAESPEARALIEAHERGEIEPYQSCNCFCGPRHGDQMGICEGEAVGTRRYEAPSMGAVDVAMCGPCLTAERAQ